MYFYSKINFMLKYILLIPILFYFQTYSQSSGNISADGGINRGNLRFFDNSSQDYKGSIFLFNEWNKIAHVKLKGSVKLEDIYKVNFNIKTNSFAKKIDDKSIFTYDLKFIDYILIDKRKFKFLSYSDLQSDKLYEIIYESNTNTLLKGFSVSLHKSDSRGYNTSASIGEWRTKTTYFLSNNSSIIKIKLSKKSILNYFNSNSKIVDYIKKNKIKCRSEQDVIRVLKYAESL